MMENENRNDDFQEQIRVWIQQQHEMALQVVEILPAEKEDGFHAPTTTATTGTATRFSRINVDDAMTALLLETNEHTTGGNTTTANNDNAATNTLYFGGVDVSFPENEDQDPGVAVYVILEHPTLRVVYWATESFPLTVPYIPGFLAFREMPPLQRLVAAQRSARPDLTPVAILVDGNGILHCRHAGLACFLGVRTGIPTIGIGKTLYCQAGLTKELVTQAILESVGSALEENNNNSNPLGSPPKQQQQASAELTETPTNCFAFQHGNFVLFDREVVQPPKKEQERNATTNIKDNKAIRKSDGNRGLLIHELSSFCHGLAIPLQGQQGGENEETLNLTNHRSPSSTHGRILACALVGHGGRIMDNKNNKKSSRRSTASQNPIFISVGHNISLRQAVVITASLSLTRIPEPVRQADLIGREMLRRNKKAELTIDLSTSIQCNMYHA
jgi:deoxyinosine 3'endonuclease (endonuclease V)